MIYVRVLIAMAAAVGLKLALSLVVVMSSLVMPQVTPPAYYRAVDRYGDPVAGLPVRDKGDFEAARAHLRKAGC